MDLADSSMRLIYVKTVDDHISSIEHAAFVGRNHIFDVDESILSQQKSTSPPVCSNSSKVSVIKSPRLSLLRWLY